jgi:SAM-dependent methyltransferase
VSIFISKLRAEVKNTLQRPARIRAIGRGGKTLGYFKWLFSGKEDTVSSRWIGDTDSGFQVREYKRYEDYIKHQQAKLESLDLSEYDMKYRDSLRERLKRDATPRAGVVLCLGARIGTEVKAFLDLGCFAIGIDLNPGPDNKYVVYGDFHNVQFPDESVDIVFTNALDHALTIENVVSEVRRVLKPGGLFITEAVAGTAEGKRPAYFESFYWSKIDDLVGLFERTAFTLHTRTPFEYPWPGEHLCFKKS